jgi:hypothetical protein
MWASRLFGLAGERTFPAVESASRPPHSSGDTPQRPDAGWGRDSSSGPLRVRPSGAPLRSRGILVAAERRRLGSGAFRPPLANRRPSPTVRQVARSAGCSRDPGGPALPLVADSVPPLPDFRVGSTAHLRAARFAGSAWRLSGTGFARPTDIAQAPLGWVARSRCAARACVVSVACPLWAASL